MQLAESAFNYSLHGRRGFELLADLVQACGCYRFTYGDLDQATRTETLTAAIAATKRERDRCVAAGQRTMRESAMRLQQDLNAIGDDLQTRPWGASDGQVVDPLEVVYRDQQGTGRCDCAMSCLEDPEWIA